MTYFFILCFGGLISSLIAGAIFLIKDTVAPPKTPYDQWLRDAEKQSKIKLRPQSRIQ